MQMCLLHDLLQSNQYRAVTAHARIVPVQGVSEGQDTGHKFGFGMVIKGGKDSVLGRSVFVQVNLLGAYILLPCTSLQLNTLLVTGLLAQALCMQDCLVCPVHIYKQMKPMHRLLCLVCKSFVGLPLVVVVQCS